MRRAAFALLFFPIVVITDGVGLAEEGGKLPKVSVIKVGRLIDGPCRRVLTDRAILVEGERIKAVGAERPIFRVGPEGRPPSSTSRRRPSCPA